MPAFFTHARMSFRSKAEQLWTTVVPLAHRIAGPCFFFVGTKKDHRGAVDLLYPSEKFSSGYASSIEALFDIRDGKAKCISEFPEHGQVWVCSVDDRDGSINSLLPIHVMRGKIRTQVVDGGRKNQAIQFLRSLKHGPSVSVHPISGDLRWQSTHIQYGSLRPLNHREAPQHLSYSVGAPALSSCHPPCVLFSNEKPVVLFRTSGVLEYATPSARAMLGA